MVTIYDLAEITGYSAPTISKALNGTGKLSPATRKKILNLAQELGYTANMAAKSLTTKHSKLIGIIFEDETLNRGFEHPIFGGILSRFRHEMELAGFDLIFLSKNFNSRMSYIDHCRYRNVEGILAINPLHDEEISDLGSCGIPCVSINEFIPGVCTVVTDNEAIGRTAARKLYQAGHRKIAFLGGPFLKAFPSTMERYDGFVKELDSFGIKFDTAYLETCEKWSDESGHEKMKQIWERRPDITAVFVAYDIIALGAICFLNEIEKNVPQDVSVIGVDDDAMVLKALPNLSTFRHDRDTIAQLASKILFHAMAGLPVPEVVRISATYVERSSVKNI